MLSERIADLFQDPKLFFWKAKVKCFGLWCDAFRWSPFYVQGKMDIDPKGLWHNPRFVAASGGYHIPGDKVQRTVLDLEPWDTVRRDMLLLLLRDITERAVPGEMAEVGVYKGSTARFIHHYVPERKLYLFDTFSGFDRRDVQHEREKTGIQQDSKAFSDTNVETVSKNVGMLNDNVEFFPGFFPESVPARLDERQFAFVHLDADLYEPILAGLNFFYPRLSAGGVLVVHDYNSWLGARKAVQDFFKDKPEIPIPMPDKSGSAVAVKLCTPMSQS
jgi:O-methyltransferase